MPANAHTLLPSLLALTSLFSSPVLSRRSPIMYAPWAEYVTEPELEPAIFDIKNMTEDTDRLSKDYWIFSVTCHGGPPPWGPQIFDWKGNLVFYGADVLTGTQDPHVCDFKGEVGTHICSNQVYFKQGTQMELTPGFVMGRKVIIDNSYQEVNRGYGAAGNLEKPNNHDFRMMPGGESFMQPVYEHITMDLRVYGGNKEGAVSNGCFQEISTRTGKVLFQWCYLDHFPIWQTYIFLDVPGNTVNMTSHIAGKGEQDRPWDFIHVNAIDKNEDGDYLLSARHMNQALKIAGKNNKYGLKPGETVWRLNGKNGDIKMNDFFFSRQHHVSFVNRTGDIQLISLFNNAWEGRNDPTADFSTAQIIAVNEKTREAELVAEYPNPERLLAAAQGSVQIIPNYNVVVAWGARRQLTEFAPNGDVLFHAHVSESTIQDTYRGFKYPWVGKPKWPPKLLPYTRTCSDKGSQDPLVVHASWNGATEYTQWRFLTSTTTRNGPWSPAGTYERDGFETKVRLKAVNDPFVRFVKAEALDKNGHVLSSVVNQTWVPHARFLQHCQWDYCHTPHRFVYDREESKDHQCQSSPKAGETKPSSTTEDDSAPTIDEPIPTMDLPADDTSDDTSDAAAPVENEPVPTMDVPAPTKEVAPSTKEAASSTDLAIVDPTPALSFDAPTPVLPPPGANPSGSDGDWTHYFSASELGPQMLGMFGIFFGIESADFLSRFVLRFLFF